MSSVVQPCARCGARWAVQTAPMHWCPRCRGVLLSPGPIDAPAQRRNYRWVARKPDHRSARQANRSARPRSLGPTPRYREIPRWGLRDVPAAAAPASHHRVERYAPRAERLLLITASLFGAAALAETVRYLVLLRNRTRLIDPTVLAVSDVLVWICSIGAAVSALTAAVALTGWLVRLRRRAYARSGATDPRSPIAIAFGCLVPVVNLLWPGVYLIEAAGAHEDPRLARAVRIWWFAWVADGLLVAAALLWRTADSLQVQADGVAFTAFTDAFAAGVAVLTLAVVRHFDGRDLRGRARMAHRWVVTVDPAVPVIAPVQAGSEPRDADEDAMTEDRRIDNGEQDRSYEQDRLRKEVVAK
ncbi:DUF4328 domain-containing protein [Nocardia higoensis]|uniref:DUF4328 domain-containing protein n=1 Tax=Nocardia higoensis TaxID=228599 RepID=A0ABS0DEE3_9NOCA|nr:DUF4328 domain-containing protein [Nocardia higoensis]MBF6356830.1 DUF4328 domain-containing protein [Nocardia higoensis]